MRRWGRHWLVVGPLLFVVALVAATLARAGVVRGSVIGLCVLVVALGGAMFGGRRNS